MDPCGAVTFVEVENDVGTLGHFVEDVPGQSLVVHDESIHLRVRHDSRLLATYIGGRSFGELVFLESPPFEYPVHAVDAKQNQHIDAREQLLIFSLEVIVDLRRQTPWGSSSLSRRLTGSIRSVSF